MYLLNSRTPLTIIHPHGHLVDFHYCTTFAESEKLSLISHHYSLLLLLATALSLVLRYIPVFSCTIHLPTLDVCDSSTRVPLFLMSFHSIGATKPRSVHRRPGSKVWSKENARDKRWSLEASACLVVSLLHCQHYLRLFSLF